VPAFINRILDACGPIPTTGYNADTAKRICDAVSFLRNEDEFIDDMEMEEAYKSIIPADFFKKIDEMCTAMRCE
jgi:hypothetical protein